MIVDLIKKKVYVYYHMNEGEISPIYKIFDREEMQGIGKTSDTG